MTSVPIIRIAIVGLGVAGASMATVISKHPFFRLCGAAEPNLALRERFSTDYGVPVFADVYSLLDSAACDAVYIASPHQHHKAHAIAASKHGMHVIVEKPMALNIPDCDAMLDAATQADTVLMVGYTHGFDPAIRLMRSLVESGDYGQLAMILSLNYTDFLYRPRRPEELETSAGGGIFFNQVPHQVELVRRLADSPVRHVRAMAGALDPTRPTEGCMSAFVEFESGTGASLIYSGYDHFDSDELHGWVGEAGHLRRPAHGETRRRLARLSTSSEEADARIELGYGGRLRSQPTALPSQPHFGLLIATCEKADFRQSADGILVYGDDGVREILVERVPVHAGRMAMLDEFHRAVVEGCASIHDGQFGRETVKVCLALLASARERREVSVAALSAQLEVPVWK